MAERVEVMLSEEEVDRRIQEIGEQISKDYAGKQVHLVEMRTELAPDAVVWKFVLTEFSVKQKIISRSVKKINAALTITAIIQDVYGECLSTLILH